MASVRSAHTAANVNGSETRYDNRSIIISIRSAHTAAGLDGLKPRCSNRTTVPSCFELTEHASAIIIKGKRGHALRSLKMLQPSLLWVRANKGESKHACAQAGKVLLEVQTWVEACKSAQQSSANHGHSSRDSAGAQNFWGVPHHEPPLVKDLEGKGEDDDSQEAHQEISSAVQPCSLARRRFSMMST